MKRLLATILVLTIVLSGRTVWAQAFGIELFNNVMPASGAMGGASNAMPQDVQSAVYGNPATLTQFHGTQFSMGGAWIEPTYNLSVERRLPAFDVDPFTNAKSDAQGVAAGNIAVAQDFSALGMPVTVGMGLFAGSGAGVDFRHVPEANGTHANIVALDIVMAGAADLTDRLAVGGSIHLSNATLDGPFVGLTGSSSDFALRGSVGLAYELAPCTTAGLYWRSLTKYTFENVVNFSDLPPRSFQDLKADRPQIFGAGIANQSLMDGKLLLAADVLYQGYTETALFGAIFEDQWSVQLGMQYAATDRVRIRLGYAWNEDPTRTIVGQSILPPGGSDHVQYVEALFAAISQHRVTGGFSVVDVLPGLDMNFMAGGMFEASKTFGVSTATIKSYWVGTGFTWRFGRGACENGPWTF